MSKAKMDNFEMIEKPSIISPTSSTWCFNNSSGSYRKASTLKNEKSPFFSDSANLPSQPLVINRTLIIVKMRRQFMSLLNFNREMSCAYRFGT